MNQLFIHIFFFIFFSITAYGMILNTEICSIVANKSELKVKARIFTTAKLAVLKKLYRYKFTFQESFSKSHPKLDAATKRLNIL